MELLALPEGDEEKFIAEKAAEGNPADQMTIKQLRAEIGGLMEPLLEIAAEEATEKATAETKKATLLENHTIYQKNKPRHSLTRDGVFYFYLLVKFLNFIFSSNFAYFD